MLESTEWAYQSTVADIVTRINTTQGILNVATGEVVTGVETWNNAVKRGVQKMVANGITGFVDHGGHRWSPETYVTMDVRTTMASTAREAVWERMGDYSADLYQVSWHNAARELCFPWQGKVISREDMSRDVEDDEGNPVHVYAQSETSYGEPAGLFGINCGHYPIPFFPGFSRIRPPMQDEEENAKAYAESQQQRALERKLREEKRDLEVMKAQGASDEDLKIQRKKIREASNDIDAFCEKTGRTRRRNRETAPVRATWPGETGPVERYGSVYRSVNSTTPTVIPATIEQANDSGTSMLSEIYDRHTQAGGLRRVSTTEADPRFPVAGADYKNLSPETANAFTETIRGLANDYDTPLDKIRTMAKQESLMMRNSFASVSHNYGTDTAEMLINPVKCKSLPELESHIKELAEKKYAVKVVPGLESQYIPTHEFAHTLLNVQQPVKKSWVGLDVKKIQSAQKDITKIWDEYRAEVGKLEKAFKDAEMQMIIGDSGSEAARAIKAQLDTVKLSNYSMTNADEFMAEAFTNERIGVASNEYSRRVIAVLQKYFGR
jgi:hypothetical protein